MNETDKRKQNQGRPKGSARFVIQKHVFLDKEAADKLAVIAKDSGLSESAVIRQLIVRY